MATAASATGRPLRYARVAPPSYSHAVGFAFAPCRWRRRSTSDLIGVGYERPGPSEKSPYRMGDRKQHRIGLVRFLDCAVLDLATDFGRSRTPQEPSIYWTAEVLIQASPILLRSDSLPGGRSAIRCSVESASIKLPTLTWYGSSASLWSMPPHKNCQSPSECTTSRAGRSCRNRCPQQ
jgi:hypothetical protein